MTLINHNIYIMSMYTKKADHVVNMLEVNSSFDLGKIYHWFMSRLFSVIK